MEESESRISAVNAQLHESVGKLPSASLDAAAAAINAALASMNPEMPVPGSPLGDVYDAVAQAANLHAEAAKKVVDAKAELTGYIAGLGISASQLADIRPAVSSTAEVQHPRIIVRTAEHLLSIVTTDKIQDLAYGTMAHATREPGLHNYDTAAHRPYCDIVTPVVTKLLKDKYVARAQSEYHVTAEDDIHWFTSVADADGYTDNDLVVDTVYKQFVRSSYWRDLPNVYVGTRAGMISLMEQYGLPGLIPRIQKLYMPITQELSVPHKYK